MADTKLKDQSTTQEQSQSRRQENETQNRGVARQEGQGQNRGIARRQDYGWDDIFNMGPFSLMRRMSEEMDRAFASTFGLSKNMGRMGMGAWSPAIEITEREGNMIVCAELPGLDKDDVKVECTEDGLVIEGEKRQEHHDEREGFRRSERSYGHFYRMVPLPQGADVEHAQAEFRNGVLEVRVPMPQEQSRRREIPITAGSQNTGSQNIGTQNKSTTDKTTTR